MRDLLLYLGTVATIVSLLLLIAKPAWGVMGIFIARPLVDTTWEQPILFGLKLTELISTLVPIVILLRMITDDSRQRPFKDMPLKWIWLLWSTDVCFFSVHIMFAEGWLQGLQVLMRHLNGITGFYMLQAYFRAKKDFRHFAWALVVAGLFPIATGVFEGVTGQHWTVTTGEDNVVRNIGLYHDAITIRYFALQTLMGLLLLVSLEKQTSKATLIFCGLNSLAAAFVVKGTYSKSGLLTLGVWLFLWPILRRSAKGMAALAACLVVLSLYYSKQLMESVGFVFTREIAAVQGTGGVEHAFGGRWGIWTDLLNEWHGLDTVSQTIGAGHLATYAHNDYLQVLFHGGVIGLGIYLLLLAATGWQIGRLLLTRFDVWSMAALFAFIMWMVDTLGLVPSAYSGYQWFVWGIIGYSLRTRQDGGLSVEQPAAARAYPQFDHLLGNTQ